MTFPPVLAARLRLPLIAAPMLRISGPDLVAAACAAGVVGAFPTANARSSAELDGWLTRIKARLADVPGPVAPICPNIIMRRKATLTEDLDVLLRHRVEMVIASVGSPEAVIAPLHDIGCQVYADVASIRQAEKALEMGADGLVLLTAGAGGQTGWANPFAFARAVRDMFDGPVVLSGGMSDGAALWAARALGCDLAMMGTRFIATSESMAGQAHKAMVVNSRLDDVLLTQAFTGLDTNMLRPSIVAAGLDPEALSGKVSPDRARALFSERSKEAIGPKRWVDIWSAGHSVSGVDQVQPVAQLVEQLEREYKSAKSEALALT